MTRDHWVVVASAIRLPWLPYPGACSPRQLYSWQMQVEMVSSICNRNRYHDRLDRHRCENDLISTCDMWHVACDMWHVVCDMWHVTCGMCHVTGMSVGNCLLPEFGAPTVVRLLTHYILAHFSASWLTISDSRLAHFSGSSGPFHSLKAFDHSVSTPLLHCLIGFQLNLYRLGLVKLLCRWKGPNSEGFCP